MQGASKIEWQSVEKLIPYAKNARTHSDEQVAQIAGSIKEFGFNNPVLVDKDNSIIAGHGRVMAARKLGMDKVPVVILDHLTESQRKAYILADNRIALNSGWDSSMLSVELQDLKDDIDLSLLGFDPDELDSLLNPVEETEGLTDEDAVPEVPVEPKTKLGDIYILGNHRLMCGDSTSITDVEKLVDGSNVDFVFTSPPYNAGDSEKLSGNTHTTDNKYGMYQDNKSSDDYLNLLVEFTNAWLMHTKCMAVNLQQLAGNKIAFIEYLDTFKQNFVDMAIWDKGHGAPQMAKNVMSNRYEYIIFLSNQINPSRAIPTANFQGTVQNVYEGKPNRNNEFSDVHAATFPVDLPEWAIKSFTSNNSTIGDCFGGTGTTLIAAEKLGKKAYLMELDPKYCDVIVKRWEDFTGKKATLLSELEKE